MEHHDPNDLDCEFVDWLKKNKLHSYQQALEEEGIYMYDNEYVIPVLTKPFVSRL